MTLEFEIPLVSFVFIFMLSIVYFSKKKINLVENKLYEVILISSLIFSILDTILHFNGAMNSYESLINNYYTFANILNKIIVCLFNIIFSSLFSYVMLISYKNLKSNVKRLVSPVIVINLISVIVLLFTNIEILKVGAVTNVTGSTTIFGYIMVAFWLLSSLIVSIINIKKFDKRYLSIFLILPIMVLFYILTLAFPGIIIYDLILALLCYIMYFTIENPDLKLINQLEYAKNTAEKANRAKSDFLSSMSHEIRTPLNAIVGLSEVIKNSDNIDEIHEDANDVVMASRNLLEIVNGILDISKIEADKMEIIESNYNPIEVFGEITSLIESKLDEKNLKLNCDFALDLPTTLYGDKGKLKQIISNILSNAIKYTEKGHIDFNVNCINEKAKCKLQIIISDTGRGIKPEQIDKIFNKFERAEEDMNSTIEGTGLGLAITKSLVEMMGGKILVHSTYGEGSKFTVLLEQKYSKDEETTKVVKDEKVNYSDKKVLIVDDNKLNIKVASKVLSAFELNIDSCDSGFGAIEKIENNEHYDIIFMDIMMPKMSGVETLKKLKQIDNFNTPVVALTADAMEGKSTKYIEVGFNDYLSKPINKDELKRVLDKCLNGKSEIVEEKTTEEDPHIHRVIPITDEDIEMLNRKMAEDLARQKEQEEKEKNNN